MLFQAATAITLSTWPVYACQILSRSCQLPSSDRALVTLNLYL